MRIVLKGKYTGGKTTCSSSGTSPILSSGSSRCLGRAEFRQDLLRNAHLIREDEEPAFTQDVTIPRGAGRLVLVTRRANVSLEFYP